MRRNRIVLAAVMLGATAVLTACGMSRTVDPVASAATKTENAGGSKIAMTMRIGEGTAGQTYEITANGSFDQGEGELTMDVSSLLGSLNLPQGSDGTIKLLYLEENGDPVVYVDSALLARMLPGGATWLKVDLQKAGQGLGVNFDQLLNQSNQNPAQALDLLRASGQVETVGPATVDGVETTEYKATVDLAKAAQLHGLSEDLVKQLTAGGAPAQLPIEAWIGADGLVRRVQVDEGFTSDGRSSSVQLTIDLSDFGTQVSVTPPPADQVLDLSGMLAHAAQGLAGMTTSPPPGG